MCAILGLVIALEGTPARAQSIVLKDGKTAVATRLRRVEGNVMATEQIGTGTGEIGYPVSAIAKIDFPEPPEIKAAAELLAQGKAAAALARIEPIVNYYAPFKDLAGNWWPQSVRVKFDALVALKRDSEAATLADAMVKNASDPESALAAQVLIAAGLVRKGEAEQAIVICDAAIKSSNEPDTLSLAWVTKGRGYLASRDWDSALLAYLHVPVFYPDETALMPQVLLGSARAYAGLKDKANAEKTFNELARRFPTSSEAAEAKSDLPKATK